MYFLSHWILLEYNTYSKVRQFFSGYIEFLESVRHWLLMIDLQDFACIIGAQNTESCQGLMPQKKQE